MADGPVSHYGRMMAARHYHARFGPTDDGCACGQRWPCPRIEEIVSLEREVGELRGALERAIAGGYRRDAIDLRLYAEDAVYHAVVDEIVRCRSAGAASVERWARQEHGEAPG